MAERWRRAALIASLLLGALPAPAAADWYFTPFLGNAFHGTTTFIDLEHLGEPRRKLTLGGSAALIVGIIGVEADYAFVPGFFRNEDAALLVLNSHIQTVTGNVILTAPLSLTRESLRPYLVAGVGWMDVGFEYLEQPFLNVDENLTAFNLGIGAIGMLGNRIGVRFDLRHFTNLDRDTPTGTTFGSARVKFWRGTIGLTMRY